MARELHYGLCFRRFGSPLDTHPIVYGPGVAIYRYQIDEKRAQRDCFMMDLILRLSTSLAVALAIAGANVLFCHVCP